ncbi:hypothetical protein [Micromonospora sp. NPDC050276]|uniref:hypothetical protein n=1 Tax=Micromonospora sp. NPDC050276 TaxID=3364278 RepID=UPI003788EBB9
MVLLATGLRLFAGTGLAAVLGASGQTPTPFTAFLAGLTAPLLVARIAQNVSVGNGAVSTQDAQAMTSAAGQPSIMSVAEQRQQVLQDRARDVAS